MQLDIEEIADKADMIINGYAFTKDGDYIRVLNLNCVNHAAVILNNRIVKTKFKVCGYYLYYTASCVIEAMHVHASDSRLTEAGSAKFFVKSNGDATVEKQWRLNEREIRKIQEFIKRCI